MTSVPVTPALRVLRTAGVPFTPLLYAWKEPGGARASAEALGVPLETVIKTLILEDDAGRMIALLMHGDRDVALGVLARQLGVKRVDTATVDRAQKKTGYLVGGISPFGQRTPIPLYAESTIQGLPRVRINGGKRGFLVELETADLVRVLNPQWVDAAQPAR